jgi:hypothetical protein
MYVLLIGRIQLLNGEGACPPEDSNGQPNMGYGGFEELCKMRSDRNFDHKYREAANSINYKKIGRFDPTYFDIEVNRRAILEAIGSSASCPEGAKVFSHRMNLGSD